jgi:hypothetical protein
MEDGTYEDGFRDGWESVAGKEPLPATLTYPPEGEARDYQAGFQYGKAEATVHFTPGSSDHPPHQQDIHHHHQADYLWR